MVIRFTGSYNGSTPIAGSKNNSDKIIELQEKLRTRKEHSKILLIIANHLIQ